MADRQLLHTAHIPVRWGDMDSYGHVNNTLYFQYLEEARVAWFETSASTWKALPRGRSCCKACTPT